MSASTLEDWPPTDREYPPDRKWKIFIFATE